MWCDDSCIREVVNPISTCGVMICVLAVEITVPNGYKLIRFVMLYFQIKIPYIRNFSCSKIFVWKMFAELNFCGWGHLLSLIVHCEINFVRKIFVVKDNHKIFQQPKNSPYMVLV